MTLNIRHFAQVSVNAGHTSGLKNLIQTASGSMFEMDNGWQASANAWIANMGEQGDFGRRYVLDPVMLQRSTARAPKTALDVGCGEGRFCRMLKQHGIEVNRHRSDA